MRKLAMAALLLLFAIPVLADDSLAGKWHGALQSPGAAGATLIVELHEVDGVLQGTVTIGGGVMYLEPIAIAIDGARVTFRTSKVAGNPIWNGTIHRGGKVTGDYHHLGQRMGFYLTRE